MHRSRFESEKGHQQCTHFFRYCPHRCDDGPRLRCPSEIPASCAFRRGHPVVYDLLRVNSISRLGHASLRQYAAA
jgi:hypothetical protein